MRGVGCGVRGSGLRGAGRGVWGGGVRGWGGGGTRARAHAHTHIPLPIPARCTTTPRHLGSLAEALGLLLAEDVLPAVHPDALHEPNAWRLGRLYADPGVNAVLARNLETLTVRNPLRILSSLTQSARLSWCGVPCLARAERGIWAAWRGGAFCEEGREEGRVERPAGRGSKCLHGHAGGPRDGWVVWSRAAPWQTLRLLSPATWPPASPTPARGSHIRTPPLSVLCPPAGPLQPLPRAQQGQAAPPGRMVPPAVVRHAR